MVSQIIDFATFSLSTYSLFDCIVNLTGRRGLDTYEIGDNLLTKKRYNFSKKEQCGVKDLIFSKKFDNVCTITLDRVGEDVPYDTRLGQYKRIPVFGKIKDNDLNFIYYVVFTDEFKEYVKKHNMEFNLSIVLYNKIISRDSSGPNCKYEIVFSVDKKYYTKMKLVDLVS